MGDVSESLKSNFLTSQWVLIIVISAKNLDFLEFSAGEFHLDELTFSFGFDHFTCDFEGVVHFGFLDVFPVGYGILDDDLKGSGTWTINEFDEKEGIISLESGLSGPSHNGDCFVEELLLVFIDMLNSGVLADEELGSVFLDCYLGNVEWGVFVESVFRANQTNRKGEIDVDWYYVGLNNLLGSLFRCAKQVFGYQFVHLIHCKNLIELKYYSILNLQIYNL